MAKGELSNISSQLSDTDQNETKSSEDIAPPQNVNEGLLSTQPCDVYTQDITCNGNTQQDESPKQVEAEHQSNNAELILDTKSLISDKKDADVRTDQDPQQYNISTKLPIGSQDNNNIEEVLSSYKDTPNDIDNTMHLEQNRQIKDENNTSPKTLQTSQVDVGRSNNTLHYLIILLCVAVMIVKRSFLEPIIIILTILAEPYFYYANLSVDYNLVAFESKYKVEEIQENHIKPEDETNTDEIVLPNDFNEIQDMVLELPTSGRTLINWLSEEDLYKLKDFASIRLHTIYKSYDIDHKSKTHRKKKSLGGFEGVYKVDLDNLLEQDKHINQQSENMIKSENRVISHRIFDRKVPLIICKLIAHLEQRGLEEEGILRKAGNTANIRQLLSILDQHFYSNPTVADEAISSASAHDVASVFKTLLRDLPVPLLTEMHMAAFYKTHKVPNLHERLLAMTMLILQLPPTHRDTLYMVLELCSTVASHEATNKMSLTNVATIMAPNLFQPQRAHNRIRRLSLSADKNQAITDEMIWTNETPKLMGILIKYKELIWMVPQQLMSQLRTEYSSEAHKQKFRQLIWRKSRVDSFKESTVEANNEEMESLNVTMPQFNEAKYKMSLSADTTVKDVLVNVLKSGNVDDAVNMNITTAEDSHNNPLNHSTNTAAEAIANVTNSMANNSMLSNQTCKLRSSTKRPSLQNALLHHALHECGGNIGERLLDSHAKIKAIYQENPAATFVVKCHHCNNEDYTNNLSSNIDDSATANNSTQENYDSGSESVLLYPNNWNTCIQILISLPIYPTACALLAIFAAFYSMLWDYDDNN